MGKFLALWSIPIFGAIALVAGMLLLAQPAPRPVGFGWFAYAPLSGTTFAPLQSAAPFPFLAVALVVVGAALIAGWAGYRLGRRSMAR